MKYTPLKVVKKSPTDGTTYKEDLLKQDIHKYNFWWVFVLLLGLPNKEQKNKTFIKPNVPQIKFLDV